MKKGIQPISIIIISAILVFGFSISVTCLFAEDWAQPTADAPSEGFIRPVENEGTAAAYYTPRSVEVSENFMVEGGALFADTALKRVGIGESSPAVTLDVNGPIRIFQETLPGGCAQEGMLLYAGNQNRAYVCDGGWRSLHIDFDGDGQID